MAEFIHYAIPALARDRTVPQRQTDRWLFLFAKRPWLERPCNILYHFESIPNPKDTQKSSRAQLPSITILSITQTIRSAQFIWVYFNRPT